MTTAIVRRVARVVVPPRTWREVRDLAAATVQRHLDRGGFADQVERTAQRHAREWAELCDTDPAAWLLEDKIRSRGGVQ